MSILLTTKRWAANVLKTDSTIAALCGDRVYPFVANFGKDPGTSICFRGVGLSSVATKDGAMPGTVSLEVSVNSTKSAQVSTIADAVADALERAEGADALLVGYHEQYYVDINSYEGVLTFRIEPDDA